MLIIASGRYLAILLWITRTWAQSVPLSWFDSGRTDLPATWSGSIQSIEWPATATFCTRISRACLCRSWSRWWMSPRSRSLRQLLLGCLSFWFFVNSNIVLVLSALLWGLVLSLERPFRGCSRYTFLLSSVGSAFACLACMLWPIR